MDAEAGIKAVLAQHVIDEIVVIGGAGSYTEGEDLTPVDIRHGRAMYNADRMSLSTYGLLQRRIAQYEDESAPNQNEAEENLPEEMREKLISFIREFRESDPELKNVEGDMLFDVLAQSDKTYENFWTALFEACPELRGDSDSCRQWVKNYLYAELKPSAKLKLLPDNKGTMLRFIPGAKLEDGEQWVDSMVRMEESITEDEEEINLYVLLNSDDAADTFVVLNMLDILVSMPESGVHLKKIYTVRSLQKCMAGIIRDDTDGFGVTELFHAIRAFLNYGKANMIADIWEKSGEQNESIAAMVYAMRDVDAGLSMCNVPEIENGIMRLRELFRDEKFWRESGYYGMMFSIIAESIREDYGALMEGDGKIPFIDMVKWAYRHQFYQQTLTIIEAKTPDELVDSGIFYYCNDEADKDQITKLFAEERLHLRPHEYFKMDSVDHYFIKTYNRFRVKCKRGEDRQQVYSAMRAQSVDNKDPSKITGFTACDGLETLQNILFAYYHVCVVRNKISHAEAGGVTNRHLLATENEDVSVLDWMKDAIDYFIDSYDKAMAEVKDKNPQIILITSDDVKIIAENMREEYRKSKWHM
jgi:hypothetical protein